MSELDRFPPSYNTIVEDKKSGVRLGDRVLIQLPDSHGGYARREAAGTVKYLGHVDSEVIDTKLYVGVKLDEPSMPCHASIPYCY